MDRRQLHARYDRDDNDDDEDQRTRTNGRHREVQKFGMKKKQYIRDNLRVFNPNDHEEDLMVTDDEEESENRTAPANATTDLSNGTYVARPMNPGFASNDQQHHKQQHTTSLQEKRTQVSNHQTQLKMRKQHSSKELPTYARPTAISSRRRQLVQDWLREKRQLAERNKVDSRPAFKVTHFDNDSSIMAAGKMALPYESPKFNFLMRLPAHPDPTPKGQHRPLTRSTTQREVRAPKPPKTNNCIGDYKSTMPKANFDEFCSNSTLKKTINKRISSSTCSLSGIAQQFKPLNWCLPIDPIARTAPSEITPSISNGLMSTTTEITQINNLTTNYANTTNHLHLQTTTTRCLETVSEAATPTTNPAILQPAIVVTSATISTCSTGDYSNNDINQITRKLETSMNLGKQTNNADFQTPTTKKPEEVLKAQKPEKIVVSVLNDDFQAPTTAMPEELSEPKQSEPITVVTAADITSDMSMTEEETPVTESKDAVELFDLTENIDHYTSSQLKEKIMTLEAEHTIEKRTTGFFRYLVKLQVGKLTRLSTSFDSQCARADELNMTESVQGDIRAACGLCRLLMKERFTQFTGLIDQCDTYQAQVLGAAATSKGDTEENPCEKVSCVDLQGFWDMVHNMISDIEAKFVGLEKLEANGWIEMQAEPTKNPAVPRKKFNVKPVVLKVRVEKSSNGGGEEKKKQIENKPKKPSFAEIRKKMMAEKKANAQKENEIPVQILEKTPVKKMKEHHKTPEKNEQPANAVLTTGGETAKRYNLRARQSDLMQFNSPCMGCTPHGSTRKKNGGKRIGLTPATQGKSDGKGAVAKLVGLGKKSGNKENACDEKDEIQAEAEAAIKAAAVEKVPSTPTTKSLLSKLTTKLTASVSKKQAKEKKTTTATREGSRGRSRRK